MVNFWGGYLYFKVQTFWFELQTAAAAVACQCAMHCGIASFAKSTQVTSDAELEHQLSGDG